MWSHIQTSLASQEGIARVFLIRNILVHAGIDVFSISAIYRTEHLPKYETNLKKSRLNILPDT